VFQFDRPFFFFGNDDIFFHSSSEVRGYPLLEDTNVSIRIATPILKKKYHDDACGTQTNFILINGPLTLFIFIRISFLLFNCYRFGILHFAVVSVAFVWMFLFLKNLLNLLPLLS
jgi:hypothetical protein